VIASKSAKKITKPLVDRLSSGAHHAHR
jgi:hypothetical protein